MGKTSPWTYPAAAMRAGDGGCQWLEAIAGGRCARRRWCFSMRSATRHSSCGAGSPVLPGQPFEQVVDLGACRFAKHKPRLALDIAGDDAAVLQDMLAHGKPDTELLLVADQRKMRVEQVVCLDRKSTRLNSSHVKISYAVFCLKKKNHINTILSNI